MKKLLLATLLLSAPALAISIAPKVKDKERAFAAAKIVQYHGYRCDSIDSFRPFIGGGGFVLICNNYSYKYELEDKGGRWVVTVD